MTQEKKNNLVHYIQLSLIALCFGGTTWIISSIIDLKVEIAKYQQKQDDINSTIQTLQDQYKYLDTRQLNHETRITILEQNIKK
jgi:hypothetical protein